MKKRVAVIGGKGMLGSDLIPLLEENSYEVTSYDLPEFDICNEEQCKEAVSSNDYIINCAALTNVDGAEEAIDKALAINADAVAKIGKFVKEFDRYMVHISTDFVFGDFTEKHLKESDAPSPLNIYGRSKLSGENKLDKTGCRHATLRIEWTYGEYGNNFITKIIELSKKLDTFNVVDDQVGAPTHTKDVARAILALLRDESEGLFHFAAKGYASRYEVANFILKELNNTMLISPVPSSEFKTPAKRPLNSRFDCSKIDEILDFERPFWQTALSKFLKQIKDK